MESGIHHKLSLTSKLFDIPTKGFFFGHIRHGSMGGSKYWVLSIVWNWDKYLRRKFKIFIRLLTSTLLAVLFYLKLLFALIKNSIFELDFLSMMTSTENNGLTLISSLYEINSKSPSGGMNDIILSFSNLEC